MSTRRRILITRLSHVGDCILTLPLAHAIKQQDPESYIAWVVQPPAHTLLLGCRAIDRVIVARPGFLKRPAEILRLRSELRSLGCTVTLDPQSLTKSALLAWLSAAGERVGFGGRYGKETAPWLNSIRVNANGSHLVDRTLELLVPIGMRRTGVCFDFEIDPTAEMWVVDYLVKAHLGCEFAVINPGAGWLSKRWPPRRFARVARHLGETYRMPSLIVWHGDEELRWSQQIVEGSGGHSILAPPTNLMQLAGVLKRAQFCVAGDTGPLHLACAMQTACIGIYGPTLATESGAYGPQHLAVQSAYTATPRRLRKSSTDAIQAVEVEPVVAACDAMVRRLRSATTKPDVAA